MLPCTIVQDRSANLECQPCVDVNGYFHWQMFISEALEWAGRGSTMKVFSLSHCGLQAIDFHEYVSSRNEKRVSRSGMRMANLVATKRTDKGARIFINTIPSRAD